MISHHMLGGNIHQHGGALRFRITSQDGFRTPEAVLILGPGRCILSQYWMGVLPLAGEPRVANYMTNGDWQAVKQAHTGRLSANILQAPTPFALILVNGFPVDAVALPELDGLDPLALVNGLIQKLVTYK